MKVIVENWFTTSSRVLEPFLWFVSFTILHPHILIYNDFYYPNPRHEILEISSSANPLGYHLRWAYSAFGPAAHRLWVGLWRRTYWKMENGSRIRELESTMGGEYPFTTGPKISKILSPPGSWWFQPRDKCQTTQAHWGISSRAKTTAWFGGLLRRQIANYSLATENFHPNWTYLFGPCASPIRSFWNCSKWERNVLDIKFLRLTGTPRKRLRKCSAWYDREVGDWWTAVRKSSCYECNQQRRSW